MFKPLDDGMLVSLYSISCRLGFSITWTKTSRCPRWVSKRGTRDQIANICWIIEKAREIQKNIYLCFIDYAKAFDCVDNNKLWKTLKEMGIPDHLTCLLRNLYAGQEATVRTRMEQLTGSGLRKEYDKAAYCHHVYLTYTQSTWWKMLGWMSYKLKSRVPREITITSVICRWYYSNDRKWRGTK